MMRMRWIVMVAAAGSLAGCGGKEVVGEWTTDPVFTVEAVELTQATDAGVAGDVRVVVDNPNTVALPLTEATYELRLNGATYRGRTSPNATAPAQRQITLRLPAAVRGEPGDRYQVSGTIHYKPPGQLREAVTDMGWPLPSASFKGQGQVTGQPRRLTLQTRVPTEPPADGPADQPADAE